MGGLLGDGPAVVVEEVAHGRIAANHALARALNISGTPSFVVGDEMLRGFLPADQMALLIADIRAGK